MASWWEQVRELPGETAVTALPGPPASARVEVDGVAYDRVPDTGWTMLVAWTAGAENLVRLPDRERHTVKVTIRGGPARTEPRTQADQDVIDSGIEEYLADARVPRPPRGYRWYQRVPQGCSTLAEAYARINAYLRDSDPGDEPVRPDQPARAVAALFPR